jgi:hypothetical protein
MDNTEVKDQFEFGVKNTIFNLTVHFLLFGVVGFVVHKTIDVNNSLYTSHVALMLIGVSGYIR